MDLRLKHASIGTKKAAFPSAHNFLTLARISQVLPEPASARITTRSLDDEDLRDYLASEPGELHRFDEWVKGTQSAWLFLESVDELKLIGGKLERALGRVATALRRNVRRARVVLSCRPSDWRPVQDLDAFKTRLPISETLPQAMLTGEDAFLAPFRKKGESDNSVKKTPDKFRCVVMLPLAQEESAFSARSKWRGRYAIWSAVSAPELPLREAREVNLGPRCRRNISLAAQATPIWAFQDQAWDWTPRESSSSPRMAGRNLIAESQIMWAPPAP